MTKPLDIELMNKNKNIFKMSIPIFIELMLQLLVGNIDQIMVSQYSSDWVAAIINGNQIMNLVIIVLNMTCMATTVVLSQYLGSQNKKESSKTCSLSIFMIGAASLLITAVLLLCYKSIFNFLHVQPEIMKDTSQYLIINATFIVVQGLYLCFASILRTYTLMKEVMFVSIIMNLLNIAGNAILINGWLGFPQMGVTGAAISTVISKTIGLFLIIILYIKLVKLPIGLRFLHPFPKHILNKLCKLALPSGAESLSYNLSQMYILSVINAFGSTMVTATKGYCSIFANFAYVYAIAISQATQIVLGYLIGAQKIDALNKRVWSTLKVCLLVCVGITIILYLNSDFVFLMFTSDPEVLALGKRILFLEIILEIGRAVNILMTRSLIAVGDAKTPMIFGITCHWIIAYAFSFLFGQIFHWGLEGVWLAMAIDECVRGLIYTIKFKMGTWKKIYQS